MMEIEPSDAECITHLKSKLPAFRIRRASGLEIECRDTIQLLTQYSMNLEREIEKDIDIMYFFWTLVQSLINPIRQANVVTETIGLRPCELWERFAEYFLRYIDIDGLLPFYKTVVHNGRSNDRGVDVLCLWPHGQKAVVQVKRGFFFRKGKGTDIVLKLIGSMVIFDAKIGIIFTNENESDVKADAREIIEKARESNLMIHVLGITKIMDYAGQQTQSCKTLMIEFFDKFLK